MADENDGPGLAVDGLQWSDVCIRLRELAEQLRAVADYIDDTEADDEADRLTSTAAMAP